MNKTTMAELMTFTEYVKQHIEDEIWNYEGQSVYGCDLAYKLTETINADGTATYNTAEAKDYIHEWWNEAGEYWEYENFEFGEHRWNPFDNPEAYMVCMIIAGVESAVCRCSVVEENWNDEFELTTEVIEQIVEYVNNGVGTIEF